MSQETERYQLENNGNSYLVRTPAGSGGGTDVEANPEGTATEDLEKLKVGETIYGIPEGYDIHTYTDNKTYTSSDVDYEQLKDDITNKRVIQISSSIVYCQDVTTSASILFTYITAGTSSTATTSTRYLITYDETNNTIEIASPTIVRIDKVTANPTLAGTENALTGLQIGSTKYKVDRGMSQTDADARYLQLSGGTMTGNIKLNNQNAKIIDDFNNNVVTANNSTLKIGDTSTDATIYTGNWAVRHIKNNASYNMYDESNGVGYTTTAPTADNTKGGLVIVVLTAEPATYYNGYYYIIAPST